MPSYTNKAINTNEMQKWRKALEPESLSQLTNLVNQKANQSDLNITNTNVNSVTSQLVDIAIDVKHPPVPLVGAKGDGSTDDTTAINNILKTLILNNPSVIGHGNYPITGGAKVIFPKATYVISSTLQIPSLLEIEGNMSIIKHTGTDSVFTRLTETGVDGVSGITIKNFILNGNNTAQYGINFDAIIHSTFENIWVYNFTQSGIQLLRSQWTYFEQVKSIQNGKYGFYLDQDSLGYPSNNNVFVRCFAENNGVGGLWLGYTQQNSFQGCTFQFHNGVNAISGVQIQTGLAIANNFIGCHFEQNYVHANILSGNAYGTSFTDCYFVIDSSVVTRFVVNKGIGTTIKGGCSNASTLQSTNGSTAPFEQYKSNGDIAILGGTYNNATDIVCYDDGTLVTQGSSNNTRVAIVKTDYNGLGFAGSLAFDQYGWGSDNYLNIGLNYVFPTSGGDLLVKQYGKPSSASDGKLLLRAVQSSIVVLSNGSTISTSGVSLSRVKSTTTDLTGLIMQVGTYPAQEVWVTNEGTYNLTFASSGSYVNGGSTITIPPNSASKFVWNSGPGLWFKAS